MILRDFHRELYILINDAGSGTSIIRPTRAFQTKGVLKMKIFYENDTCVFELDKERILDRLRHYAQEHNVQNAKEILSLLERFSNSIHLTSEEHQYIEYIVLESIEEGEVSALCKVCQKAYHAEELVPFELGYGKSPFSGKTRLQDIFSRKPKMPKTFGGKGYKCPRGHELISRIIWIA